MMTAVLVFGILVHPGSGDRLRRQWEPPHEFLVFEEPAQHWVRILCPGDYRCNFIEWTEVP